MEYSFSAKSWHVKLYKFLWYNGYEPEHHYNTMCPYFWMTILGLVLSPFLILRTIFLAVGGYIEDKLYDSKLARQASRMEAYLLALDDLTDKSTESLSDFLSKMGWKVNREAVLKKYEDEPDRWAILEAMYDIESNREFEKQQRCEEDKQKFQEKIDKIRYNPYVSKILAGIAFIAAAAVGVLVLYAIYRGLYWFLHLFTFQQFLSALLAFVIGILIGGLAFIIIFGLIKGIRLLTESIGWTGIDCAGPLNRWVVRPFRSFCYGVGAAFVKVFNLIGNGIIVVVDMIKSIYHQSCPRVTWKK